MGLFISCIYIFNVTVYFYRQPFRMYLPLFKIWRPAGVGGRLRRRAGCRPLHLLQDPVQAQPRPRVIKQSRHRTRWRVFHINGFNRWRVYQMSTQWYWVDIWFHIKGTKSVHSFNGDYLSFPEGTGSRGYLSHEIPSRWLVYSKSRKQLLHRKNLLYDTSCTCLYMKFFLCLAKPLLGRTTIAPTADSTS